MNQRPVGVTVVGVLVLIAGVFYAVGGILALVSEVGLGIEDFAALPIILLVFGLIYLLVAKGLFDGSPVAQLVVGIVTVLALIGLVINLFAGGIKAEEIPGFVVAAAINLLILVILFGAKGRAFFSR